MSFNVLLPFPELITCCLLSCCFVESSHPMLLCLNSSLYPNSAFGLWKRILWQATILACPSRYGCLLIRRMAVLEGAFEKCGNLRICGIYGRSSWECFKKASRLRVQRVDMLAMLANPWPIVKLAGFAWKPHRSTALTRRRWWLWWIEAQKILSLRVTIGDWLRLQESGTNGVRRGNRLLATVQSLAQRANWRMTLFDVALCCMIFKSFLVLSIAFQCFSMLICSRHLLYLFCLW